MCALGPQVGQKAHELRLANTCVGMFWRWPCWFVALPSVCGRRCHRSVPHSRRAARTGRCAARATALTLVSWCCHTSKGAAGHQPESSGGPRARARVCPRAVFFLVNMLHAQLLL